MCAIISPMSLSIGIVGLPNVGKSTLFNALAQRRLSPTASHPFTTIEPHEAVVAVPDENLKRLEEIVKNDYKTRPDVVPAAVTFIDIAGLVKGAAEGEGLGNKFLAKIREVDAIVHVVRNFEDQNVPHIGYPPEYESIKKNIEIVQEELKKAGIEKPTLYVLNVSEKDLPNEVKIDIKPSVRISAKLEEDLADLSLEEREEYLGQSGIESSALDKLIKESYKLLNLITFYTIKGGKEVRATPIVRGSNILQAAEKVHTDFAKNFIKAEAIPVQTLIEIGSWKKAHEAGKIALSGRDYIIRDGDVVEFKVNA